METRLCKGRFRPNRGKLKCFDDLPIEKQNIFIEIKNNLQEMLNNKIDVYVFGSYLGGYWDEQSDYDVFIREEIQIPSETIYNKINEIIGFKVDIFFETPLNDSILIP